MICGDLQEFRRIAQAVYFVEHDSFALELFRKLSGSSISRRFDFTAAGKFHRVAAKLQQNLTQLNRRDRSETRPRGRRFSRFGMAEHPHRYSSQWDLLRMRQ